MYFDEDFLVLKKLNIIFALKYRLANPGILVSVKFKIKYFIRPPKPIQQGQDLLLSLDRDSVGINNSSQKEPNSMSVIEEMID